MRIGYYFLSGAITLGCWISAGFFFRFWRDTRDRLFIIFGLAFVTLGVERLVQLILQANAEEPSYTYLIRLLAFMLILGGIADKNRTERLH